MTHPSIPASAAVSRPPASASIHNKFLEKAIPAWLIAARPQSVEALKATPADMPAWYKQTTAAQREALNTATIASFTSQAILDEAMSDFIDIDAFAKPLLIKALKDQFDITLDVEKIYLRLRKPFELGVLSIEISSFEVLKLPLLQAVLHNFEASECRATAFHATSGFVVETAKPGEFEAFDTRLTVAQLTGLCRSLDIGAHYQVYLKAYLYPDDGVVEQARRKKFITAQKDALRAAAELALLKKDIDAVDYDMILGVVDGEVNPWSGGRPVWFNDLSLMKHRMTGCVVFSICEKYRYSDDLILYVPNEPEHPLKRYTYAQLETYFKRKFTERDTSSPADGAPSGYQRFFSRFVAYADRSDYFSQFTEDAPDNSFSQKVGQYTWQFNEFLRASIPFGVVKELPPFPQPAQVPVADPYLHPQGWTRPGTYLWSPNVDLWNYLYDRQRDQLIADADSHAVSTAKVDAQARSRKLAGLLNIGMLVLGGVATFVPVLGEIMMVVMVGQLLHGVFEGAIEWSEGDRKGAKAHLIDLAQNLALMALMVGAGKGFGKLIAVKAEPVIEGLHSVTADSTAIRPPIP